MTDTERAAWQKYWDAEGKYLTSSNPSITHAIDSFLAGWRAHQAAIDAKVQAVIEAGDALRFLPIGGNLSAAIVALSSALDALRDTQEAAEKS